MTSIAATANSSYLSPLQQQLQSDNYQS